MAAIFLYLHHLLSFYLLATSTILRHLVSFCLSAATIFLRIVLRPLPKIHRFPALFPIAESILSFYLRFYCHLCPCTIDLDDKTTLHFWSPVNRKSNKPNLLMIHGYGGNAKVQFACQVGALSKSFNLYIPDLLFFGDSYTKSPDRTEVFQAKCLVEGMRRLGIERCSVFAISYGGFVGYRIAEMWTEMVEKLVIVSSAIGVSEEEKEKQMKKVGVNLVDILLPAKPDEARFLVKMAMYKFDPIKWVPDFILQEFIHIMCETYRKEKEELVKHLLENTAEFHVQILSQETLLIWGDKDKVFPLSFAYQLQRKLGPKAKLELIKDAGHAANIESPNSVNALITEFFLSSSGR